uniref:Cell cycle checkpoint control protein RAD9A n=1 Tax=Salvator merianae TaxID=96440 RepID=A0A8D0BQ06_SALMN
MRRSSPGASEREPEVDNRHKVELPPRSCTEWRGVCDTFSRLGSLSDRIYLTRFSLAMNCELRGGCIRVFGRALQAIARVSNEFWFDPAEKGLSLRAVNSSRSAYACIFFSSKFFQRYSCQNTPEVGLKKKHAVLPVFRCLNTMERNIEKFNIYTGVNDSHIVFQLFCRHGLVKTHNLAFQECDPLQVVFAKHLCPNVLKVQQLSDMLVHFPTYQDEVTLAVTPMKVCFKSYAEEELGEDLRFSIYLSPEEFEYFQVGIDSEVTFCLKEIRGFLAFAEAIGAPVSIHFDVSGKPVGFGIEDLAIEATFVLATLADTESKTTSHESLTLSQAQCIDSFSSISPLNILYRLFQFHSLLFGAVSSREHDSGNTLHSLATASDTEEDYGHRELSPTF